MTIKRFGASLILGFIVLFIISGFFLLAMRTEEVDMQAIWLMLGMILLVLLQYNILKSVFKHLERMTLLIVDFLCALSVIVIYRLDPDNGVSQFIWVLVGNAAMIVTLQVIKRVHNFGKQTGRL